MFDWVLKTSLLQLSALTRSYLSDFFLDFQNILSVEPLQTTFSKLFNDFL